MSSEAPLPRVIVVTGGGRGIGAATVRRLAVDAAAGGDPVHLVVNYANDQSSAQAVADEATGVDDVVSAAAIRADVSSESDVANLITWLLSTEASYVTGALMDIGGGR